MSAVLLPMTSGNEVDWDAFRDLLSRTVEAGLTPAVNMDTGYVQLLDEQTQAEVLNVAQSTIGGEYLAGAFVADSQADAFDPDAYLRRFESITSRGGVPIVFPSYGLNALDGPEWVEAHRDFAKATDRFYAFELGSAFVPYGKIQELDTYRELIQIPECLGAKHSSLSRELEWERLRVRDEVRPDFLVLTGNDLAIDMVTYGSDYLLGLSAFAPEAFATRDRLWMEDSSDFYAWNDLLQYLGHFAFREPVPGYKHDAAMFLYIRDRIASPNTHPNSPKRPDSDIDVLQEIAKRLAVLE